MMKLWDCWLSVGAALFCLGLPLAAGCGKTHEKDAAYYQKLGIDWDRAGDPDKAISDLTSAIDLDPKLADARYFRGINYHAKQQEAEALADLDLAIELQPDSARNYTGRSSVLLATGELDRALADANQAIKIDATVPEPYYYRARIYLAQGKPTEAKSDLTEFLKLTKDSAKTMRAFALMGDVQIVKGDMDDAIYNYNVAIPQYDERIAKFPKHEARTSDKKKTVWYGKETYEEASQAYAGRAAALLAKGEVESAFRDAEKAKRLNEQNYNAYLQHARASERRKRFIFAKEDYEQMIKLEESNPEGYRRLAWLLATAPQEEHRDGPQAVEHAREACELTDWKDAQCLEALAAAQAESGNFGEAVRYQRQAVSIAASDANSGDTKARLQLYESSQPCRDKPGA